jgi:hypothetical protein
MTHPNPIAEARVNAMLASLKVPSVSGTVGLVGERWFRATHRGDTCCVLANTWYEARDIACAELGVSRELLRLEVDP